MSIFNEFKEFQNQFKRHKRGYNNEKDYGNQPLPFFGLIESGKAYKDQRPCLPIDLMISNKPELMNLYILYQVASIMLVEDIAKVGLALLLFD